MAVKTNCGRGRFSDFSIPKLLEKKGEEREDEKEELEEEGEQGDEEEKLQLVEGEDCEIKQEKIELLGGAELSGLNYHQNLTP